MKKLQGDLLVAALKGLIVVPSNPLVRELGFHGVPHKLSACIVPTSSCLVELIGLGQKNFDMTVVFKDFKRELDGIKAWLDTTDLKYYESRLNLNWRQILKTITDDPEQFIENGEASDSDSENYSQDSDKGYTSSDVQSDSGSEAENDDSESLVESEDDDEEYSEEISEEEGKTWEELEREANNADREKGNESDSEEDRKRRKMKAFGKSRPPERRAGGSLP